MKINLTSELNKLVTDDLVQFAKCGKKLVAKTKTKKMRVGDKFLLLKRNTDDTTSLNQNKPNDIGKNLGPSTLVTVPLKNTKGYWGEQGGKALGAAAGYTKSLEDPNKMVQVPQSQVIPLRNYHQLIKK